jgi:ubiquinone/menaquinone biosynthesis C-methylase UbiE
MKPKKYVHGYSRREKTRLFDQANTLSELLHHDSIFPPGSRVLEAGCGVGAQTIILALKNPRVFFTSTDISQDSLEQASGLIQRTKLKNVQFHLADIFNLPFKASSFDHVFVCFVLEHLPRPLDALARLIKVLKPGGSMTVIEGDHGSTYFHPESELADRTIQCLIDVQKILGGNALIGRQLFPLLKQAGFKNISVSPRMVYVDSSRPELEEGFTRNTFTAMVKGVKQQALSLKMMTEKDWDQGIKDLHRTASSNGTFCYTFFKGTGIKPASK